MSTNTVHVSLLSVISDLKFVISDLEFVRWHQALESREEVHRERREREENGRDWK
jgi:hypothetical protein